MSDEATVRRFQGRPAVFRGYKGDEEVEAVVGTRVLVFHRADWQLLPPCGDVEPTVDGRAE